MPKDITREDVRRIITNSDGVLVRILYRKDAEERLRQAESTNVPAD
jgi:hypothetical protein